MKTTQLRIPPVMIITPSEYVRRKEARVFTPYIIKADGTQGYLQDGKIIPMEVFNRKYYLPDSLVCNNSENSDKTKIL